MEVLNLPAAGDTINIVRLVECFHCGAMGGIRKSTFSKTIVFILKYTPEMYKSDCLKQVITYPINKKFIRDNDHIIYPEWHLFAVFHEYEYTYLGKVKAICTVSITAQKFARSCLVSSLPRGRG